MKRKWGLAPKPPLSLHPFVRFTEPQMHQLTRRTRATVAMNHLALKLDQSLGGPSKTFGKRVTALESKYVVSGFGGELLAKLFCCIIVHAGFFFRKE